jgi:hypothetical protein
MRSRDWGSSQRRSSPFILRKGGCSPPAEFGSHVGEQKQKLNSRELNSNNYVFDRRIPILLCITNLNNKSSLQARTMLHVHDASTKGAAVIANILADGGIPSAIWGVNAAVHYGGGLCPLVRILPASFTDVMALKPSGRTLSSS